ncbi:MAG: NifB/NifX family molybdenum-iron cluster-binding protein [Azonexus sp.]
MHIAVTSQNRHSITGHAGKCRKFWVYDIEQGRVMGKQLLELPLKATLHTQHDALPEALAGINVLISGGMGAGLYQRLMQQGILPVITVEEDPDQAITAFLANALERFPPHSHHPCQHHGH